ncbi:MAG: hypothetical protein J3K34DRAFT_31690 [Monoraphidium minutum]|nr:MAG: hypothetical protein J3K34DRAFT_31690 [Monoraphidium minutum]
MRAASTGCAPEEESPLPTPAPAPTKINNMAPPLAATHVQGARTSAGLPTTSPQAPKPRALRQEANSSWPGRHACTASRARAVAPQVPNGHTATAAAHPRDPTHGRTTRYQHERPAPAPIKPEAAPTQTLAALALPVPCSPACQILLCNSRAVLTFLWEGRQTRGEGKKRRGALDTPA